MDRDLTTALAASAAVTLLTSVLLARFSRGRWSQSSVEWLGSPYRRTTLVRHESRRVPRLVRAAALSGIALGSVAVPVVTYAMVELRSDGIALSLVPGVVSAAAVWCTGWLLLARSRIALDMARLTSKGSFMTHVALLLLSALHVFAARMGWSDRVSIAHVLVATTLSLVALPQAALLKAMAARCASAFAREAAQDARAFSPAE